MCRIAGCTQEAVSTNSCRLAFSAGVHCKTVSNVRGKQFNEAPAAAPL